MHIHTHMCEHVAMCLLFLEEIVLFTLSYSSSRMGLSSTIYFKKIKRNAFLSRLMISLCEHSNDGRQAILPPNVLNEKYITTFLTMDDKLVRTR